MVVSRVLPTLIRLNHMINPITKVNLINCSRYTVKPLSPVRLIKYNSRLMSSNVDKDLNDPKRHFDYNQLNVKLKEGNVYIIDVREHAEINETGKIPGSIHIPLNSLQSALELPSEKYWEAYFQKKPKSDDEIIFTCRSGRRSQIAMRTAFELGYLKAGNYKGGWLDWAEKSKLN